MKLYSLFTILIFGFLTGGELLSSGGYSGGGFNVPQAGKDREAYLLGKSIFTKELELPKEVDEATKEKQHDDLLSLQAALPASEQRRNNLTEFAGRLTDEQLKALEYFLKIRFNIKPATQGTQ